VLKLKRCRKGAFQPNAVDLQKVLSQDGLGGVILLKDGRAKFRACLPEKSKVSTFTLPHAELVDLVGDGKYAEPVGIVPRHGKAEHRQVPAAHHCAVPFA
jgi:hypothetical protein